MTACKGCGTPLPPRKPHDNRRCWCSERCRKAQYGGVCEVCGGPTYGGDGRALAPTTCLDCLSWTDEEIIAAIDDWAHRNGGIPPTNAEWRLAGPDHPSQAIVVRRLGWDAVRAAGYLPRIDRRPEAQAEIEQLVVAGVPTREIADRFGVTPEAIRMRFAWRGTTLGAFRAAHQDAA